MSHGHSAAILRAFYQQLSRQRFQQLATQVIGLLKHIGQTLVK
jgi:ribosomal protein S14